MSCCPLVECNDLVKRKLHHASLSGFASAVITIIIATFFSWMIAIKPYLCQVFFLSVVQGFTSTRVLRGRFPWKQVSLVIHQLLNVPSKEKEVSFLSCSKLQPFFFSGMPFALLHSIAFGISDYSYAG